MLTTDTGTKIFTTGCALQPLLAHQLKYVNKHVGNEQICENSKKVRKAVAQTNM